MKFILNFLLIAACASRIFNLDPLYGKQSPESTSEIFFAFISKSGIDLKEISDGHQGEGWLIFYNPDRGIDMPSLVVHLLKQPGATQAIAEVFDAPPGFDYVPVKIDGDTVSLNKTLQPSIILTSPDGWWMQNDRVNYNLDITINDLIHATWGGDRIIEYVDQTDGPLVEINVRDTNRDGIPDWDLRRVLPEFSRYGFYRTNYMERKCDSPIEMDYGVSPEWPFVASTGGYEQEPGRLSPPIVVDWETGKIRYFSEIVTLRNQNCSYSFITINPTKLGVQNITNFETPFSFYDLSEEGQGYPNLILRTQRHPANDPWIFSTEREFETIRYSWSNEVGDGTWDYKIEVLGSNPYNFTTPIAEGLTSVDAPPYEAFPSWVVNNKWPVVTFVDPEDEYFKSSEGIYEWSPFNIDLDYYLGWTDHPAEQAFADIREGFRGEFRLQESLEPGLYFSPVDNRLHLSSAEGGLWNLGSGNIIRMHNIDADKFIDGWTREFRQEEPSRSTAEQKAYTYHTEEAIYALPGYLLYTAPEKTILIRTDYHPASFEIFPPTDPNSWQNFREQLDSVPSPRKNPLSLESWLADFQGEQLHIDGVIAGGVRITESGFRFNLGLDSGYGISGSKLIQDLKGLSPGDYLVEYDQQSDQFQIFQATGSKLDLKIIPPEFHSFDQPLSEPLQVLISNKGLEDAVGLTLVVNANNEAGSMEIARQSINIHSGQTTPVLLDWQPTANKVWEITAHLQDQQGDLILAETVKLDIDPITDLQTMVLSLSTDHYRRLPAFLVLGVLVLLALFSVIKQ